MKTWQAEMLVVGCVLAVVACRTTTAVGWISAGGVLFSFAHAQIADRLAEREAARVVPTVRCHALAGRYFIAKEIAWAAAFTASKAYPALVGVGLFLAYPAWRKWWRARHPMVESLL